MNCIKFEPGRVYFLGSTSYKQSREKQAKKGKSSDKKINFSKFGPH